MLPKSWKISANFELQLFKSRESIKCTVTDLSTKTTSTSDVIGLDANNYSRYALSPSPFPQRFFQLDEKTLRLAYTGGLKGGGQCFSTKSSRSQSEYETRMRSRYKEQEYEILRIYRGLEEEREQEASLIATNQRVAVEIAKELSRAMQHGTVEMSKISDLKRINPYACSDPLAIAQLLLENLNTQALWSYYQYSDERACITKLIRRYLLAHLLRKRK